MNIPNILVVEDEINIADALRYNLEHEGYKAIIAGDGEEGLRLARESSPDLIVLDVMLPKLDGFEVGRILRRETNVPLLMLTARGEEIDRVVGLEIGADDYVTKPFSTRELLVRIRNMIMRSSTPNVNSKVNQLGNAIVSGDLEIDRSSHLVRRKGELLEFRPREFELLALLVENKGKAYTRDQILENLWGIDYYGDIRTVDVHVRWIREKIENDPGHPVRIVTIRGIGYRFDG